MFTPRRMLRATAIGCALTLTTLAPQTAWAVSVQDQQELVDRATLAVGEVLSDREGAEARDLMPRARAVMICPRVFRAGFLFGGEGGGCVLVARGGQGTWSSPAFYSMGGWGVRVPDFKRCDLGGTHGYGFVPAKFVDTGVTADPQQV